MNPTPPHRRPLCPTSHRRMAPRRRRRQRGAREGAGRDRAAGGDPRRGGRRGCAGAAKRSCCRPQSNGSRPAEQPPGGTRTSQRSVRSGAPEQSWAGPDGARLASDIGPALLSRAHNSGPIRDAAADGAGSERAAASASNASAAANAPPVAAYPSATRRAPSRLVIAMRTCSRRRSGFSL